MPEPEYPETIMLYISRDQPHTLTLKEDICCEACYYPPRAYSLGLVSPRPPKESQAIVKVKVDTGDLLETVAEITALVEQCNDMTKEARKALDRAKPPKVSAMTQMVSSFPPAPRSIP